MTHPATDLRQSLTVAARTAQQFAATTAQIDMIVALARGSNNYNIESGGRLTYIDATRIIEAMIEGGATADHGKSEAELDDEDEGSAVIENRIAARKITKKQKEAEKELRETQKAEGLRKIDGRRVRHVVLGEGTVIAEDDKALTVLFDGDKKPKRLMPSFVTAA